MATVDKTWVFAADNEGLADAGDTAMSVVHDAGGNPGGSLEFTSTTSNNERALRASTGQTWETWGVPAGSTITSVQVISWDYRTWNTASITSETVQIQIVDSGAASVHSAGVLVSQALTLNGVWNSVGAGTSRAVDAAKQASTTDVRLEVKMTSVNAGSMDTGIDNILLRITYTAGAAATVPDLAMAPYIGR